MPAIGYIRVSMAREEMISPELQRKSIEDWARRENRRIVEWVEDLDATGRNFKRKIMRAIAKVESGVAREIGVWKYSRFGRDRYGNAVNIQRVEMAGGQLQSATEQVDARTAMGRFQRGMLLEFGAFESDRAGEQWKETHAWRRGHGLPAQGGKRFGYIWHPRCLPQLDGSFLIQEEKYLPDPELIDVIISLYQRYVAGSGFTALTHWLNGAGILNAQGRPWGHTSVRNFMDSGFPAGYLRVHNPLCTVTPYSSYCPEHIYLRSEDEQYRHAAIISDTQWRQYLRRRDFTKSAPPRARNAVYPLTALLKCTCGGSFSLQGGSGLRKLMSCSIGRDRGPSACDQPKQLREELEVQLFDWLQRLGAGIDQMPAIPVVPPRQSDADHVRLQAEREVQRLERAIKRHLRAYALAVEDDPDGTLEEEFRITLSDLRREKAVAAKQLAAEEDTSAEETERAAAVQVAIGLVAEWLTLVPAEKNALLRQVIDHAVVNSDGALTVIPSWENQNRRSS
ncbi:recombinase family protein [Streptacidiphilus sp. PAMC 29251]